MIVYILPKGKVYYGEKNHIKHLSFKDCADFFSWLQKIYENNYQELENSRESDDGEAFVSLLCPEFMININLWVPSGMYISRMMEILMKGKE